MITLQVEKVADCWDELYPLAQAHQEGTKSYRRHEPFNPDRERYVQYNEMGFFHLITARDEERLIGYFGIYNSISMHSQLPIATEDVLYLHPDYRNGRTALRIIRFAENYLSQFGDIEVVFSCEIDNKTGIQGLLKLLGYEPKIIQHSKHLSSTSADSAATVADVGSYGTPSLVTQRA